MKHLQKRSFFCWNWISEAFPRSYRVTKNVYLFFEQHLHLSHRYVHTDSGDVISALSLKPHSVRSCLVDHLFRYQFRRKWNLSKNILLIKQILKPFLLHKFILGIETADATKKTCFTFGWPSVSEQTANSANWPVQPIFSQIRKPQRQISSWLSIHQYNVQLEMEIKQNMH